MKILKQESRTDFREWALCEEQPEITRGYASSDMNHYPAIERQQLNPRSFTMTTIKNHYQTVCSLSTEEEAVRLSAVLQGVLEGSEGDVRILHGRHLQVGSCDRVLGMRSHVVTALLRYISELEDGQ